MSPFDGNLLSAAYGVRRIGMREQASLFRPRRVPFFRAPRGERTAEGRRVEVRTADIPNPARRRRRRRRRRRARRRRR